MARLAIINVGCNAGHKPLQSPIFEDDTFEFLPIPEKTKGRTAYPKCPGLPRYCELKSFYDPMKSLREYIPERFLELRVHNDPEFETFTFADYPTKSPRAANLQKLTTGDHLFFLARLVRWKNRRFTKEAGFYLIGYFEIDDILKEVTTRLSAVDLDRFKNNAHVKRALGEDKFWNGFWIFKGSKNSKRFVRAVPFTRDIASKVMRDAKGRPWRWNEGPTDLQTIGSYTRSCRTIEDEERVNQLWSHVRLIS